MENRYKLGSLFDGSGGFPLAGSLCGIEPRWAAEVEPYPIAVTRSRFPNMKHLGDISKVNGEEIEPVDIITTGSPCQDLSVAGKRAGLKHEANGDEETTRSGLFMEAVRIIKEMRSATNGEYPTFALWENVPGAFSSNKGADFRIVCEELIKIVEPSAVMPAVPKNGWPYADSYIGDGWSLAYRVFDAQYWGVPQRRRRIHLILDLRGERAREVLFEREGVRGYFEKGRTPWQTAPGDAQDRAGADDRVGEDAGRGLDAIGECTPINLMIATRHKQLGRGTGFGVGEAGDPQFTISAAHEHAVCYAVDQGGGKSGANFHDNIAPTLCTTHGEEPAVAYSFDSLASNSMKSSNPYSGCRQVDIARCLDTTDPNPSKNQGSIAIVESVPYTLKIRSGVDVDSAGKAAGKGALIQTDPSATLGTSQDQYLFQPVVFDGAGVTSPINASNPQPGDPCHTLNTDSRNLLVEPVYCLQGNGIDRADTAGCNGKGRKEGTSYTLNTIDRPAVAYAMQGFGDYKDCGVASGLKARDYKDATDLVAEAQPIAIDRAYFNQGQNAKYDPQLYTDGTNPTLVARGPSAVAVRYIVRRLTPTECARLQGFADRWGDIDEKDSFSPEEYEFWQEVRNTHAAINGKKVQEYTEQQMRTWYNKLHTDSAEYKMWGNGIALPPALYCMQGIADALENAYAE